MSDAVSVLLDLLHQTFGLQVLYYLFSGFKPVQSRIGTGIVVECAVFVKYVHSFKPMPVAYLKIVRIMRGSDLNDTAAEFGFHKRILDNP